MDWKLAEAKNKFSEVINKVLLEGPQRVVRRNQSFVILEEKEYQKLMGKRKSLIQYLLADGPTLEGLDLSRDGSSMRKTNL
jgi:prevent-host-death family protein